MSKKETFLSLCRIMANMEDAINALEGVGFIVEPDKVIGEKLYDSCSIAYRVANNLLETPDVEIENIVCNELLTANGETVEEVAERIWNLYGIN